MTTGDLLTTEKGFVDTIRSRCQARPRCLALPESEDPRILLAARQLLEERSVREVMLGTTEASTAAAAAKYCINWPPTDGQIRYAETDDLTGRLPEAASRLASGAVDAVMAGNVATTAAVIRAGISGVGLAPGVRTVSGAFLMDKPGVGFFLYADCGVVIAPTTKQLVDIAVESVRTWRMLQPSTPPVVAFLSFSTKGSASHEIPAKMAEAAQLFKEQCPDVQADGELQFDAAMDAEIGQRKAPGSKVPGRANCLIFPDLNAGNIAYKITQRLGGFAAYGPILQGLAKPFSDLSRGATVADIVASAYINLLRARPT